MYIFKRNLNLQYEFKRNNLHYRIESRIESCNPDKNYSKKSVKTNKYLDIIKSHGIKSLIEEKFEFMKLLIL